jgi:hypothetical protein
MRTGLPSRPRIVLLAIPVLAIVASQLAPAQGAPPSVHPDGSFLGWAARGDLARDAAVGERAIAAWDAAAGDHHDVRLLYAGTQPLVGRLVVLQGRSPDGDARLAFLSATDGADTADEPLTVLDDRAAPDPHRTRQVSLLAEEPDPSGTPSGAADGAVLAVALAEPGAVSAGFTSWAWDTYGETAKSPVVVERLPASATVRNTTLTILNSGATVYSGPPDAAPAARGSSETVGKVTLGYIPAGLHPGPEAVRTPPGGGTVTSREWTNADGRRITVHQLSRPGLAIGELSGLLAPGNETSPANAHDGRQAIELRGRDRGFAAIVAPGVGLVVIAQATPDGTIDAYHVFQATSP